MKDENYILVPGWAINKLKLEGVDLLVFSIIHGFSQDGESRFTGSIKYLESSTNKSRSTVIRSLNALVEKGFIAKHSYEKNGVKYASYWCVNFGTPSIKMIQPSIKMTQGGGAKMIHNSTIEKILLEIKSYKENGREVSPETNDFLKKVSSSLSIDLNQTFNLSNQFRIECELTGIEPKQDHFYRWIKSKRSLPTTKVLDKKGVVDWDRL